MIVRLEENQEKQEIEVVVQYPEMNATITRLEEVIKSVDKTILCHVGEREIWISASAIFYIESVDKQTFVYCEKEVYCAELRLYQLYQELSAFGFVQVSKACILNSNLLEGIIPLRNSRMEAILSNGEHVTITRKFIPCIREKVRGR